MGWEYSIKIGGYTFNHGDIIFVKGNGYLSAYAGASVGINYGENYRTRFYGVYSASGVIDYPICVGESPDGTSPTANYFIKPDQIVSGGTPDKYTYSFNANGGSGAPSAMTKTYGEHFTFPTKIPTRPGHTFLGWNNGSVNNGKTYAAGETVIGLPDQDIIWWADWEANEYIVTYKANGGTGSDVTQTVTYGQSWTSKGAIFSLTGHKQTSWNTKANGTGVTYSLNTDQTNTQLSDLTLYAIYSANSYDLTVDPNGGNWSGSPNSQYFNQKYGSTKRIADPVRVGYVFKEWSLSGYGSIEDGVYTFGAGNGTLTAQWERMALTVTFDSETNGGSSNTKRSVYYGDTVGSLPVPKKPYYKFVGWFTKAVGGTQISASQVITSNVTYYAQFKIDASVKVGQNGEKTPAIVWVGQNGVWSKVVTWLGEKRIWNKSTGADE